MGSVEGIKFTILQSNGQKEMTLNHPQKKIHEQKQETGKFKQKNPAPKLS